MGDTSARKWEGVWSHTHLHMTATVTSLISVKYQHHSSLIRCLMLGSEAVGGRVLYALQFVDTVAATGG